MALAAIQIALVYGLDVYTTVSSRKEKEFLLHRYSALKGDKIVFHMNYVYVLLNEQQKSS